VAQEGKRIRTALFEVRVVASPLVLPSGARTRIGLIVPRYQQSAVARNMVKRRLRELARTRLLPADIPADLVIRVRPEAYRVQFQALAAEIDRTLTRLLEWRNSEARHSAVLDSSTDRTSDTVG